MTRENLKLQSQKESLQDANDYYKLQFDYLKKQGTLGNNGKLKKDFERVILITSGFACGVFITIGVIKLGKWVVTTGTSANSGGLSFKF